MGNAYEMHVKCSRENNGTDKKWGDTGESAVSVLKVWGMKVGIYT